MAKKQSYTDLKEDALTYADDGIKASKQNDVNKVSNIANTMYGDIDAIKKIDAHSGHDSKKRNNIKKVWNTVNMLCDKPNKANPKMLKKLKKNLRRI